MGKALETLRKRLAVALDEHGTVANLAESTGFSRKAIERWRDGPNSPKVQDLETIAAALGTTAWDLIRPEDAETRQKHDSSQAFRRILAALSTFDDTQIAVAETMLGAIPTVEEDAASQSQGENQRKQRR